MHLDQHGDPPPGIPDTGGKNPLLDKRVREALRIAIDRNGIVDKIMDGVARAGRRLAALSRCSARSKDTPIDKSDPAGAKKLLADAGYPNGFSITLGAPTAATSTTLKVAQAVARCGRRIGVKTEVDADDAAGVLQEPRQLQVQRLHGGLGRRHRRDQQRAEVADRDARQGRRAWARPTAARYSNPAMDAKLEEALRTVDDAKREALLAEASQIAMADHGAAAAALRDVGLGDEEGPRPTRPRRPDHACAMGVKPAK